MTDEPELPAVDVGADICGRWADDEQADLLDDDDYRPPILTEPKGGPIPAFQAATPPGDEADTETEGDPES